MRSIIGMVAVYNFQHAIFLVFGEKSLHLLLTCSHKHTKNPGFVSSVVFIQIYYLLIDIYTQDTVFMDIHVIHI